MSPVAMWTHYLLSERLAERQHLPAECALGLGSCLKPLADRMLAERQCRPHFGGLKRAQAESVLAPWGVVVRIKGDVGRSPAKVALNGPLGNHTSASAIIGPIRESRLSAIWTR